FFSSRRRHTRFSRDWSSDVCSSDLDRDRGDEDRQVGLALVDLFGQPRRGVVAADVGDALVTGVPAEETVEDLLLDAGVVEPVHDTALDGADGDLPRAALAVDDDGAALSGSAGRAGGLGDLGADLADLLDPLPGRTAQARPEA